MEPEQIEHVVVDAPTYRRSDSVGKLMQAIAKAQCEVGPLVRSRRGDKGNTYADLASVLEVLEPFQRNGIAILQFPTSIGGGCISVSTLLALGEEWIDSTLSLMSMKTVSGGAQVAWLDPQGTGSGITYARRYALMAIGAIAPEDDDGARASKQWNESRQDARANYQDARTRNTPDHQQKEIAQRRIAEEKAKSAKVPEPFQPPNDKLAGPVPEDKDDWVPDNIGTNSKIPENGVFELPIYAADDIRFRMRPAITAELKKAGPTPATRITYSLETLRVLLCRVDGGQKEFERLWAAACARAGSKGNALALDAVFWPFLEGCWVWAAQRLEEQDGKA